MFRPCPFTLLLSLRTDTVDRLIGPRERILSDAEAKPWRRVLYKVLSPEAFMSLRLPGLVEDVTLRLRRCARSEQPVRLSASTWQSDCGITAVMRLLRLLNYTSRCT